MSNHAAWSRDFTPPEPLRTERIRLEVLGPDVARRDYEAIMGSRGRLRRELEWGNARPWPADDFTLAENRRDLEDHHAEFERREAYAYTVLDPSAARCIGCIYIERNDPSARVAFWVIDDELHTGLEAHLLGAVLEWLGSTWLFDRVVISLRPANGRGIAVIDSLGLRRLASGGLAGHTSFFWPP